MSDPNRGGQDVVLVKVGGSVLTGVKAFRRVALFLKHCVERAPNEKPVVVVSAQKVMTDSLERRARRIVRAPAARSLDLLWSTGELRSVALLALHLQNVGVSSVGLSVHETGLQLHDEPQAWAGQPSLTRRYLEAALTEHAVVVVPGFLATGRNGRLSRWDAAGRIFLRCSWPSAYGRYAASSSKMFPDTSKTTRIETCAPATCLRCLLKMRCGWRNKAANSSKRVRCLPPMMRTFLWLFAASMSGLP